MDQNKQNKGGAKKHGNFSKFIRKTKPKTSVKPKEDKKEVKKKQPHSTNRPVQDEVRINKYIANAGICSRREADALIANGEIKVNGQVVTELGRKIMRGDKVSYKGKLLKPEKMVYILLNKPKGYITTTEDPFERKIVMNLVSKACEERIFPVGRLDRNTTGLLLFTNDGDIAKKLTHPSHNIKKIYHVVLDKPLTKNDLVKIQEGLELEDGSIKVDKIAYAEETQDKRQVGIEIHSGKNRIVRRIFEHLEYNVVRLDRVSFAGLTKKDIPRGKYRFLKEFEINRLKMLG
ncbi:MAG: pseudouridine synthase [Bacteroidetes bacterium]|nr:pseudouridine synthase [Bacteroidota bacterium]